MRRICVLAAAGLGLVAVAVGQAGSTTALGGLATEATIVTVAGTGVDGSDGDGGPAAAAAISHPRGIAVLGDGSYVFAQPFVDSIRRVAAGGTIATTVGTGRAGYSGDGGPAADAQVTLVHGVAAMPDGGYVLADMGNNRIRRVWADGRITTVAGTGVAGFAGDGGPATAGQIALPRGLTARANGEVLIADTANQRVRRLGLDGTLTTVAGSGVQGFAGDGGSALSAQLNRPFGVAPMPDGGFVLADVDNHRIRRVWPNGTITTVAGNGSAGFSGDGGLATTAALNHPHAVVRLPDGGLLVADTDNQRIRRVWPDQRITTVAGTGVAGYSGDGGLPLAAQLNLPKALAVLPDASGFLVGDAANNRIRLVRVNLRPPLSLRVLTSRLKTRAGRPATLRYTLSDAATVRVEIVHAGIVVSRMGAPGKRGTNRRAVGRRLDPGSYTLRLTATTPDKRKASGRAALSVKR